MDCCKYEGSTDKVVDPFRAQLKYWNSKRVKSFAGDIRSFDPLANKHTNTLSADKKGPGGDITSYRRTVD